MKSILITIIALIMLGFIEIQAQHTAESPVSGINEIVLFEKVANGLRVAEVYMGTDDKESRIRYLKWAASYDLKGSTDYKKFILFSLRPKKLTENNRLIRELLEDLKMDKEDDAYVAGMIPVYENKIELNGKTWLLEKKPWIIKEKGKRDEQAISEPMKSDSPSDPRE